jgi:hypothetical protein
MLAAVHNYFRYPAVETHQSDTPEHLLNSGRERFARIGSLSSSKANKFGAGKSESSSDEDATEPLKTVMKGARIVPMFTANIAALRPASASQYHPQNARMKLALPLESTWKLKALHKAYYCNDFDHGEGKFGLAVTPDAKQIDCDNDNPEYSDEDSLVHRGGPEFDCYGRGSDFEWKDN